MNGNFITICVEGFHLCYWGYTYVSLFSCLAGPVNGGEIERESKQCTEGGAHVNKSSGTVGQHTISSSVVWTV